MINWAVKSPLHLPTVKFCLVPRMLCLIPGNHGMTISTQTFLVSPSKGVNWMGEWSVFPDSVQGWAIFILLCEWSPRSLSFICHPLSPHLLICNRGIHLSSSITGHSEAEKHIHSIFCGVWDNHRQVLCKYAVWAVTKQTMTWSLSEQPELPWG